MERRAERTDLQPAGTRVRLVTHTHVFAALQRTLLKTFFTFKYSYLWCGDKWDESPKCEVKTKSIQLDFLSCVSPPGWPGPWYSFRVSPPSYRLQLHPSGLQLTGSDCLLLWKSVLRRFSYCSSEQWSWSLPSGWETDWRHVILWETLNTYTNHLKVVFRRALQALIFVDITQRSWMWKQMSDSQRGFILSDLSL